MTDLSRLSPTELAAAMRGGTAGWGKVGSADLNIRYAIRQHARKSRKCWCGCGQRASHRGMANGVCLIEGCAFRIARWVRDGK